MPTVPLKSVFNHFYKSIWTFLVVETSRFIRFLFVVVIIKSLNGLFNGDWFFELRKRGHKTKNPVVSHFLSLLDNHRELTQQKNYRTMPAGLLEYYFIWLNYSYPYKWKIFVWEVFYVPFPTFCIVFRML